MSENQMPAPVERHNAVDKEITKENIKRLVPEDC
jgi:hypothetical protein